MSANPFQMLGSGSPEEKIQQNKSRMCFSQLSQPDDADALLHFLHSKEISARQGCGPEECADVPNEAKDQSGISCGGKW